MSKVKNISGFPEWLPQEKLVEDKIIAQIKEVYQLFGFTPLETPAVELKSTLQSKGVIDKEIYLLRRALKDPSEKDEEELALHFDLTVPFARYVGQHYNELQFPFKRYQLQKVWRGERPQRGRFREFYQFDIDIIARDTLPIACDAEIISVLVEVFNRINIGQFEIRVNNRKLLIGLYESFGLNAETIKSAITAVDKIDKIGVEGVRKELLALSISEAVAAKMMDATTIRLSPEKALPAIKALNCTNETFAAGLEEVTRLFELIPSENVLFDLSLARGLDYYTGSIFEVFMSKNPEYGSFASGGRYDDLASQFINKKLPGVGVSIGITRLMDLVLKNSLIEIGGSSPTKILVTVYNEEQRIKCLDVAKRLRHKGLATEVYPTSPKLGKQIDYASSKGIPFVCFLDEATGLIKMKNLMTKEEVSIEDLGVWCQTIRE